LIIKLLKYLILLAFLTGLFMLWSNYRIGSVAAPYIYSDTTALPACKAAVLLGTSKHLSGGAPNDFFYNRIEAAVRLFNSGKIKYIIISGDNSKEYYNEPVDMKKELVKKGIPDSLIVLDYAGLRTFDSMIRAKEIFGQTKFIVVSQKFHNERAVFIARHYEMEAYGYNAEDVTAYKGFKTKVRELFARVKVFIDIYTGKKPKFLGEKVVIP
jgi:SanA protein